jgi:hypothetical protein
MIEMVTIQRKRLRKGIIRKEKGRETEREIEIGKRMEKTGGVGAGVTEIGTGIEEDGGAEASPGRMGALTMR